MTKFSINSLKENIFQFVFNLDVLKWLHTLKPNRIRAKKKCFSDWSTAGNLPSQESRKGLVTLAKQVFSKLKRHETPSFAQLLYKFPSAIMVIIMKLSFPIFSIIKRCSIICANFNISPLEIIVSIILNYLNGRKTTTTTTNKPQLKKRGGECGKIIYDLWTWESFALWKEWFLWKLMKWSVQLHC